MDDLYDTLVKTASDVNTPVTENDSVNVEQPNTSTQTPTPLILVVDDEKHICNIIEEYFSILGYQVMKALNAETGIKQFMASNPAIVITDLDIDDCTGFDIARKVKQHSPDTTIILISGHPIESLDISTINDLIDYTLQKPIDFSQLAGIIKTISD